MKKYPAIICLFCLWPTSASYDVEVEANIRLGKKFVEQIKDHVNQRAMFRQMPAITPKPSFKAQEIDVDEVEMEEVLNNKIPHVKKKGFVGSFINHIIERGIAYIQLIGVYLKRQLELRERNLVPILKYVTEDYLDKMEKYAKNYILKKEIKNRIDEEMVLLDIVESSNKLLFSEQRKLINAVIEKSNGTVTLSDMQMILESLVTECAENKRREFQYICQRRRICKTFPGFTEYLGDLVKEILKLSDRKLYVFMKNLAKIIRYNKDYIQTLIYETNIPEIIVKLKDINNGELAKSRESLSIIRSSITNRHRMVETEDSILKIKTQSLRIIFDMIDKIFEEDGEDIISITFDSITRAIRDWASDSRNDIETIINTFVNHFLDMCKHHWNANAMEEIRTLIQLISTGQTTNQKLYKILFTQGSNFTEPSADSIFLI